MAKKKAKQKSARPATRAPRNRKTKPKQISTSPAKRLFAIASPKSIGGISMFEAQNQIVAETVANFYSEGDIIKRSVDLLKEASFDVLQVTRTMINFSGTVDQFQKAFNTEVYAEERPVIKENAVEDTAEFFDARSTDVPGMFSTSATPFDDLLEGVAFEEPRYYMASAMPPLKAYWHLDVPSGVSIGCNADRAHRMGVTGKGIKVVMVDSGWFHHPFFTARGYRVSAVTLGPGASDPLRDESGHGTGESANIFALAPDVELLPVKMSFVNSTGAFNAAVGLNPDIITCSWGSHKPRGSLSSIDQALAIAISSAVAAGITVVFSAGNGHAGFPGQHPDVISAGGVFMGADQSLQASNYSSGFDSEIYIGRRVPDLCGLVGMRPKAAYIMLPLEPGDEIDRGNAGGTHPNGDETTRTDGWAAFSGTSAAAPQLAGAAALVKQGCPSLAVSDIKEVLKRTARDVTAGTCNRVDPLHHGLPATVGPDSATGNGLVDAQKAVLSARIRSLGPVPSPASQVVMPTAMNAPIESLAGLTRTTVPVRSMSTVMATAAASETSSDVSRLSQEEVNAIEDIILSGGFSS